MSLSKLLTTMINRVQGIDYLIFSIVARGREREWRRGWNNRRRIAPISIFFSFFPSTFRLSRIFFLPFLSPFFISIRFIHPLLPSLLFSIPHFPPARIGFVSSPRDFNCQFNGSFFFFFFPLVHTEANDGFLRSMENENAFFVRFHIHAISAIRDFVSGKQWGEGGGSERFVVAFSLIFLPVALI